MHRRIATGTLLAALCGCTVAGPGLDPIDDQVAAVGQELVIELSSSGSGVTYGYSSSAPRADSARMTTRPDGTGLFVWTPSAADVGNWVFDFSASDSGGESTDSVMIDVRSAVGSQSVPLFRRPLGEGTAVNIQPGGCVEIQMVATDQDSTEITFAEEEPRIEGATLFQESEFEGTWRWCPTPDQVRAQERYLLTLSADDSENPRAIKRYQIILREPNDRECGGTPPVLAHTASDKETVNPLVLEADVTDESGLKAAPLVYFSTTEPSDPPDLSQMTQLTMALMTGDTRTGHWSIELPNPVADMPAGTQQTLWYVVVAEDNDDSGGKCDHLVTQTFQMNVAVPSGDGGLGLCEPCTSDAQCGDGDDNCLRVGVEGESFCFKSCTTDDECDTGYLCSPSELSSVDGVAARQCVPLDETCDTGNGCPDDSFEQNDGRAQAQAIEAGTTGSLRMCPVGDIMADEDWYTFTVTGDTDATLKIAGDTYPNMELSLLDADGRLVAASEDWGSDDDVTRCLKAGTYSARVYSYFSGENDYSLALTEAAGDCRDDGGGTCEDDVFEDDDDSTQARIPDYEDNIFRSTDNAICSGDDDYFFITLFGDETIYGTLEFDQVAAEQDLDFLVYDSTGTLLTPCTEEDPSGCDSANGQSGDSDETLSFTAPAFGEYYVVVHGWAGAENSYDICLALDAGLCVLP